MVSRSLRTFEDNRGLTLHELPDGRWVIDREDPDMGEHATTGEDDWPMDARGEPLDGCVSGRGLAPWEKIPTNLGLHG